jgi:hypothetical protein
MSFMYAFKFACKMYSILFCFAQTYLLLFPMFMLAYSSRTYECLMTINTLGEADIEIVFWFVSMPFVFYGIFLNMSAIARGK